MIVVSKKRSVFVIILMLVIGFAAVSTTLVLNGVVGIGTNNNDFEVIFVEGLLNGEESSNIVIDETKKKLKFDTNKITKVGIPEEIQYSIKNNSTIYDADVTINCTMEENEYIEVSGSLDNQEMPITEKIRFAAQEVKSGKIIVKMKKSYPEETDMDWPINCTIQADAIERENVVNKTEESTPEVIKTITFDGNGGKASLNSKEVKVGESYGELPTASKPGYNLEGWYTASVDGIKITEETIFDLSSSTTLYAHWTEATYTLSFDANGGNPVNEVQTVTYNGTYGALPETTYNDYVTFVGWFTKSSGGTQIQEGDKVTITKNTTLYAHYESTTPQAITYITDVGYFDNGLIEYTEYLSYGQYASFPNPTVIDPTMNYMLSYWVDDYTGEQVYSYEAFSEGVPSKRFRAVWEMTPMEQDPCMTDPMSNPELCKDQICTSNPESYPGLCTPTEVCDVNTCQQCLDDPAMCMSPCYYDRCLLCVNDPMSCNIY